MWLEPDAVAALAELTKWRYPSSATAATAAVVNEHKRVLKVIVGEKA